MPEAVNGDVTLYYEDEGSGPPVLLIHGHTLDRRLWDPVVPSMLAAGLRVLRIDLRGHGLSTRPDFGYHPSHHAGDVAAVLDAAAVGPVVGVGHSIGGAVVLEIAVTMPQRLAAMVLVSPVMPDRKFEPAFMENLREVAGVIRSEGVPAAMAGPWASSPLFEHSFRRPEIRHAACVITRDFPGADYLATSGTVSNDRGAFPTGWARSRSRRWSPSVKRRCRDSRPMPRKPPPGSPARASRSSRTAGTCCRSRRRSGLPRLSSHRLRKSRGAAAENRPAREPRHPRQQSGSAPEGRQVPAAA